MSDNQYNKPLAHDVILEIGRFVSPTTTANLVLVNRSLCTSFAHHLYKNVHLIHLDQASRFFQMLRRPSATELYRAADMVKNLQLGFGLRFGSTDQQVNAEDGRHPFFDIYEPCMEDLQYGLEQLHSLTSLNVFVDLDRDPTALTRLIHLLDGELQAGSQPFVLRLKCLKVTKKTKTFHTCHEWECSGESVNTLQKVSDLEIITTHIPKDPGKVQRVIEGWMSKQKEHVVKRICVRMGAELWEERADFSVTTGVEVGPAEYFWKGHWKDGVWDWGISNPQ